MRRVLLGLVASAILAVPAPASAQVPLCGDGVAVGLPTQSDHFTLYGPDAAHYGTVLDDVYRRQVTDRGWWAPPPPSQLDAHYTVVIDGTNTPANGGEAHPMGSGGDNPNSDWTEADAKTSCLHLTDTFANEAALQATAAREFNRMVLTGIGALEPAPDPVLTESSLALMEQITFEQEGNPVALGDLWPDFADSLGDYNGADPRSQWLALRGLTERYGGGGDD